MVTRLSVSTLLCVALLTVGCGDDAGDGTTPDGSPGTADAMADAGADSGSSPSDGSTPPSMDATVPSEAGFPDASAPGTCGETTPPSHYRVVGYYANWTAYARRYYPKHIPASMLTHINYAFLNITPEGECVLGDPYVDTMKTFTAAESVTGVADVWTDAEAGQAGNLGQLRDLRAANPHLKLIFSIGGWTWSGRFSDVALTAESRARFTRSCVAIMAEHDFDGLDVDWEYPVGGGLATNTTRPEDRANYNLLLAEMRSQLDTRAAAESRTYELSIAAPAGAGTIPNYDVANIHESLDFINLMAYDLHGAWSEVTNHNAPMRADANDPNTDESVRTQFNVHTAVNTWIEGGTPPEKLVLGVPFYGHGFRMVSNTSNICGESGTEACNGLFQSFGGAAMGTYPDDELGAFTGTTEWSQERGAAPVEDIQYYLSGMGPGTWERHWSEAGQVPWIWNSTTGVMISYDDAESICIKRDYAVARGLGGTMIWELSADDGASSLTEALQ